MTDYKCTQCGECLESMVECFKHHQEIKHTKFEIPGTDIIQTIVYKAK